MRCSSRSQVEIRSGLGNGNAAVSFTTQEDGKPKKKASKKVKPVKKTIDAIFKETREIRAWLEAIEEDTKLVKRLQTVILHSAIPDRETKDKLANAMIKIKTLSLRTRSSLKALEKHKEEQLTAVETRMLSVQHSTLSKRFQSAMADYQAVLAHHKDQTESHIKTQLRIVIQTVTRRPAVLAGVTHQTPEELEALLDNETTQVFVDNYVQETQAMKTALQDAKMRHKEMLELEKSIKEMHDLFTDLATMVHTQGEMINVIEYNIEHGTTKVADGNTEMSKAYTKKKSARRLKRLRIRPLVRLRHLCFKIYKLKKLWCFILVLCIVGIILAYVALHTLITSIFTF
ncbi:syntaxin-1B-like isoform X3 [Homalodisca vitripennis]|uniref:syntaxin-1B-like isoform X3 n=1 Tax=Homalodisca vitripennis TaxID=197043 RepID=UPI001EECE798|nr:syntaxin-1B-like isoform X3 [Homalodisca vitripennis]